MKPETMMIDDVKYVREDSIQVPAPKIISDCVAPWNIGANYLIRTATMIDTGRLVAVTPTELVLEDAAWIPDTGRFAQALVSCVFSEVEPFTSGRVIIGRGAVIDAVEIKTLPRGVK